MTPTGTGNWPASVKRDLTTAAVPPGNPTRSYLDEAAEQIGTSATNDFVNGALHDALRDRLFAGLTSMWTESPAQTSVPEGCPRRKFPRRERRAGIPRP